MDAHPCSYLGCVPSIPKEAQSHLGPHLGLLSSILPGGGLLWEADQLLSSCVFPPSRTTRGTRLPQLDSNAPLGGLPSAPCPAAWGHTCHTFRFVLCVHTRVYPGVPRVPSVQGRLHPPPLQTRSVPGTRGDRVEQRPNLARGNLAGNLWGLHEWRWSTGQCPQMSTAGSPGPGAFTSCGKGDLADLVKDPEWESALCRAFPSYSQRGCDQRLGSRSEQGRPWKLEQARDRSPPEPPEGSAWHTLDFGPIRSCLTSDLQNWRVKSVGMFQASSLSQQEPETNLT